MTEPTTLYRAYADDGALLYIGIAKNWGRRWAQHSERSPWFAAVARVELERHPTREAARHAEAAAVRAEHPRHNIEHTDRDTRPMRQRQELRDEQAVRRHMVRSYDHTEFALLPEYHEAAQALSGLANRLAQNESVRTQDDFAALVATIALHVPYGDGCDQCMAGRGEWTRYPVAVVLEGVHLRGTYVCLEHRRRWTCWYHVDVPCML